MKNITVSVDDEVYRQVRIGATEANTSLSAMVKAFLLRVTGEESDFERRKRFRAAERSGHPQRSVPPIG